MNYLGEYWNEYWGGYWDLGDWEWIETPHEVFRECVAIATALEFCSNTSANIHEGDYQIMTLVNTFDGIFQTALWVGFKNCPISIAIHDRYKELEVN